MAYYLNVQIIQANDANSNLLIPFIGSSNFGWIPTLEIALCTN